MSAATPAQAVLLDGAWRSPPRLIRLLRWLLRNKVAAAAILWLVVICALAAAASVIGLHDPNEQDLNNILVGPGGAGHLFGTDDLGRDILSRIIFGGRVSLFIGLAVASVGGVLGSMFGLLTGYFQGRVDSAVMLFMDALQSLPNIILALGLLAALGTGTSSVIIALSVSAIPAFARVVRAEVLQSVTRDYVMAARSLGASDIHIILRHTLRDATPTILVQGSIICGLAIVAEAALGFLGVGVKLPTPTWGNMLSEAYIYTRQEPLFAIFPGAAITITVLALNMLGDSLRDVLDPKGHGRD